jgi:hypothetical protein
MKTQQSAFNMNQGVARAQGGSYYASLEIVAPDYCESIRGNHRATLAKVGTVITVL